MIVETPRGLARTRDAQIALSAFVGKNTRKMHCIGSLSLSFRTGKIQAALLPSAEWDLHSINHARARDPAIVVSFSTPREDPRVMLAAFSRGDSRMCLQRGRQLSKRGFLAPRTAVQKIITPPVRADDSRGGFYRPVETTSRCIP